MRRLMRVFLNRTQGVSNEQKITRLYRKVLNPFFMQSENFPKSGKLDLKIPLRPRNQSKEQIYYYNIVTKFLKL